MLLLLVGHALASELPQWPEAGATVPGECTQSFGIAKGQLMNPLLVGMGSLARCSFVAEPLTSYSHLLAIEVHAKQLRALYVLDTAQLIHERDYWQEQAERATPLQHRPWFVAVTTSALVTGIVVTYSMSTGGP